VIGDSGRIGCVDSLHIKHVDKKSGELKTLFGECLGAFGVSRIVGKEFWIMQLQHARAGTGGCDHIIEALEDIDNLTCDRLSVGPVS